ncbi:hypothetical protein SLEP1_g10905 [Rubroshorea leprosula]|uniref:Uncharacterized protein n=1 Tax=Rubroshorea leprosula TaxID=152421 RepID=A0AAV5IJG2_9ROSI|nr:hypothetical protein SLEP1_g10905 [Rubroshorea leprosula]
MSVSAAGKFLVGRKSRELASVWPILEVQSLFTHCSWVPFTRF